MEKQTAKRVTELVLEASGQLDDSVAFVRENCSGPEFVAYRDSIGKVMHDLWATVLDQIYSEHPDLKPPELNQ